MTVVRILGFVIGDPTMHISISANSTHEWCMQAHAGACSGAEYNPSVSFKERLAMHNASSRVLTSI